MKMKKWIGGNQVLEYWKTIENYEGIYMISSLGRVKSLESDKNRKEKILKLHHRKDGYLQVVLCKNGQMKTFKVHRLVASAFIPNVDNKPCIDHIDTNRLNNNVNNLRWVTSKENNNNPLTKKKMSDNHADVSGENNPMYGKHHTEETRKKIGEANKGKCTGEKNPMHGKGYKVSGEKNGRARKVRCHTGEVFTTLTEACKWCGLKNTSNIASQIQGKYKSAGKHPITGEKLTWEYIEEVELDLNIFTSNINISL